VSIDTIRLATLRRSVLSPKRFCEASLNGSEIRGERTEEVSTDASRG
jgi:hypothetical protein